MGHVPSKEVSQIPFVVDLQGAKGGIDRMMAVALTQDNFPSVDCPLFQQFVKLRCDPSVLHWFNVQDVKDRTSIPPAPSAEYLYQKHVMDVNEQLAKGFGDGDVSPIPICLFRLVAPSSNSPSRFETQVPNLGGSQASYGKTVHDILAREEAQIVGYVGCRVPKRQGGPTLSVFLDKSLWNEAKSISIFQIGCKCYEHFSRLCGLQQPQWPTQLQACALDTNLPTLRLIQKITREYQRPNLPPLIADHTDGRVTAIAQPLTLLTFFGGLASSVVAEAWPGTTYHRRFCVLTQRSTPNAVPPPTPFDAIVDEAKRNWGESNALVVAAKKEAEKLEKVTPAAARQKERDALNTAERSGSSASATPSNELMGVTASSTTNTTPAYSRLMSPDIAAIPKKFADAPRNKSGPPSFFAPHVPTSAFGPPPTAPAEIQQQQQQQQPAQQIVVVQQAPAPTPSIKLPFQTDASILLPTSTPGVLQPFPVKWCENDIALKPSSQRSQHPGMLLELVSKPQSGSINVIGVNGVTPFVVPDPCYVNLAPGTTVFVQQ